MKGKTDTIVCEEKNMAKDKFQESKERWKRDNLKTYMFRLSKVSEADMIEHVEKCKPVYAYIKGLIRKDMESKQ